MRFSSRPTVPRFEVNLALAVTDSRGLSGGALSPCGPAATQQRRRAKLHPSTQAGSGLFGSRKRRRNLERIRLREGLYTRQRRVAECGKYDVLPVSV